MRTSLVATALLALAVTAGLASAASAAVFTVSDVSVQTRDGSPWSEGAPIVLVVRATSPGGVPFPERALSVVMQTDGERTKCLDVAMKQVALDGTTATYAGIFYPFRAATYDGRFGLAEDVADIRFTVGATVPAAAAIPADAELPVLGPVTFEYSPLDDARVRAGSGIAIAAFLVALIAVMVRRRRRTVAVA